MKVKAKTLPINSYFFFLVNGGWGDWSEFSACDATCGGRRYKERNCSNPYPMNGGDCPGEARLYENCTTCPCKSIISS